MAFTAIECTPSALLDKYSCLQCLSDDQLLAIIALAMAQASQTYANDVAALLADSACYTCLSEKQMLQAATAIIGNMGFPDESISEIREKIKCLLCADPRQIKAAILFLLCNYFQTEVTPQ